jgi:hypothetical protein
MWFVCYARQAPYRDLVLFNTVTKEHPLEWILAVNAEADSRQANYREHLVSWNKLTDEDVAILKAAEEKYRQLDF